MLQSSHLQVVRFYQTYYLDSLQIGVEYLREFCVRLGEVNILQLLEVLKGKNILLLWFYFE